MAGHGTFCWNELMTRDPKKARDFYGPMLIYELLEKKLWPLRP